jgi:hypothetical protein
MRRTLGSGRQDRCVRKRLAISSTGIRFHDKKWIAQRPLEIQPHHESMDLGKWIQDANQSGSYRTLGTAPWGNVREGRQAAASWIDTSEDFLLFGGFGRNATGTPNGTLNDLRTQDPAANQWTMLLGSAEAPGWTAAYRNDCPGLRDPMQGPRARAKSGVPACPSWTVICACAYDQKVV